MRDSSRLPAVRFSVVLYLVLTSCVLPAAAQLYTRSITGAATDTSGVVVPGAHVVATDLDKGFAFLGITDSAVSFLLRSSGPVTINGPLEIAVGAKGLLLRTEVVRAGSKGQPE
jgi:hypothetical protein